MGSGTLTIGINIFSMVFNSFNHCNALQLLLAMRIAYAEYAVHADYAHMRKYADADVNLIHINHIYNNCQKLLFFGKNMG